MSQCLKTKLRKEIQREEKKTCRMGIVLVKGRLQKRKLSYNIIHVLKEASMAAIRVLEGKIIYPRWEGEDIALKFLSLEGWLGWCHLWRRREERLMQRKVMYVLRARGQMCCAYLLSYVWQFATPWTVAHQALLFLGLSRLKYWSGLPFPSLGDLPDPGIKSTSPVSPVLQKASLPLSHRGSPRGQM